MLRDPRFYLLLPGQLAPAIIGTAIWFHHLTVADFKGWSLTWITGNYAVYAVVVTAIALFSGPLVDRFRAVRMVYGVLPPLVLAMLAIAAFQTPWIVPIYISLLGFNSGLYYTVITSLWAEIYGVTYIGAIKSMMNAISVLGSAIGPVIMGGLIDWGLSVENICFFWAAFAFVGWLLTIVALNLTRHRSHPPA